MPATADQQPPHRRKGRIAVVIAFLVMAGIAISLGALWSPTVAVPSQGAGQSTRTADEATIHFASGSAYLSASAQQVLSSVAREYSNGWQLDVTGYVQQAGQHYNDLSLSRLRANAVRTFLRDAGVLGPISVRGLGIEPEYLFQPQARIATVTWTRGSHPAPTATTTPSGQSPAHKPTPTSAAKPGSPAKPGTPAKPGSPAKPASPVTPASTHAPTASSTATPTASPMASPTSSPSSSATSSTTPTPTPTATPTPAPTVPAGQAFGYGTGQPAGTILATVVATDPVAVTGFRFLYADGTTSSTTSENGFFRIDTAGNISLTTAGLASAANSFLADPNTWTVKVQAGNAAGGWSPGIPVTLREMERGFLIYASWMNWWGNQIFSVWVPDDTFNPDPAATRDPQTWTYYRNGQVLTHQPNSFPIPYGGPNVTQGQIQWNGLSTWNTGDTFRITVAKDGIVYQTPVYTCP